MRNLRRHATMAHLFCWNQVDQKAMDVCLRTNLEPSKIKPPLQREHDPGDFEIFETNLPFGKILAPTWLHLGPMFRVLGRRGRLLGPLGSRLGPS